MDYLLVIILVSGILVFAFLLEGISRKISVSSVIFLLLLGVIFRLFIDESFLEPEIIKGSLPVLGTLGLVLIVLEGALELKITRQKAPMIGRAFKSSFLLMVFNIFAIGIVLSIFTETGFYNTLIYAIPLSVISSAVAIPTAKNFHSVFARRFITYESSLSDIFGIIIFNLFTLSAGFSFFSLTSTVAGLFITVIFSYFVSILIIYAMDKFEYDKNFVFIISMLMLIFAMGKYLHFSSLILIFFFGLIANNLVHLTPRVFKEYVNIQKTEERILDLHFINSELVFVIKTLFFIAFGFSFELMSLVSMQSFLLGALITFVVFVPRYFYLKRIERDNFMDIFHVAPRGLITIILFISIPRSMQSSDIGDGLILYVILFSLLVMTIGAFNEKIRTNVAIIKDKAAETINKTKELRKAANSEKKQV